MIRNVLVLCLLMLPATAQAYIGPGVGAGVIGVVLGVLAAIVLALFGIFWYPLKRMFKAVKNRKSSDAQNLTPGETPNEVSQGKGIGSSDAEK